jgi:uncharacterized protein YgbK (DUF1537 family)
LRWRTTIVVLDDDPTGIQTVHGNLVLTCWDRLTLNAALTDEVKFFYLLTNTRSMTAQKAAELIQSAMEAVLDANLDLRQRLVFISRSDSTLRSHFPVEIDAITAALQERSGIKIDASFLVPAFFEGGRQTIGNVHYLTVDNKRVPTDRTEFARDQVFGYGTSRLPNYIEEKTNGRVAAESVGSVSLEMLRQSDNSELSTWLQNLAGNRWVVVNAENYTDLDRFCDAARTAMKAGKQFVFQSAASLVKSITQTRDKPLLGPEIVTKSGPGLVVIGSHVLKTTVQLQRLFSRTDTAAIELDVGKILNSFDRELRQALSGINAAVRRGLTPVVYTSRVELVFPDSKQRLACGQNISALLSRVVREISYRPSFVLAKGGITAHEVLVNGLQIKIARVGGQILPGVPVIILPDDHILGGIPYVIFPGNVGGPEGLSTALDKLKVLPSKQAAEEKDENESNQSR